MTNMRLQTMGCPECGGRKRITINLDRKVIDEILLPDECPFHASCWEETEIEVLASLIP